MIATGPTVDRICGCMADDGDAWPECLSCKGTGYVLVELHPFVTLESAMESLQSLRTSLGIIREPKIPARVGTPAYYWEGAIAGLESLCQQLIVMLPDEYERTEGDAA